MLLQPVKRQLHNHGGTLGEFTFDPQPPVMQLYDLLADGQAQAASGLAGPSFEEFGAELCQVCGLDAFAVVGYGGDDELPCNTAVRRMAPWAGVNLKALSSKLTKTCFRRLKSPSTGRG